MEHLNVLPDWDMFQTDHLWSTFHGAARCLSGGPIYITDIPGKHDVSLIHQITATTIDGRSIILRPDTIGRTSEIYVAHAEARLLRVETNHQTASIIGLFNVGLTSLREMVNIALMPGVVDGESYVIRPCSSGAISGPYSKSDNLPIFEVEIAERGFEILTASPVHTCGRTAFSVLGLLGKMTGAAAIRSLSISKPAESSQVEINVGLKALGSLGTNTSPLELANRRPYANNLPGIYVSDEQVNLAAVKLAICGRDLPTLRYLEWNHPVLVVDTISAWNEYRDILGQQSDMKNKFLVFAITISCT